MYNTNLFDILRSLSKEEFKEFGELARSPFFNTNKTLVKLYDLIKKHYPDLEHRALKKEHTFKKLFPGEAYNDGRIRLLVHSLSNLAEEYLRQLSVRLNAPWPDIYLLDDLKKRRLFKAYEKTLASAREINGVNNANTSEFYFIEFTIEQSNIASHVTRQLDVNEKVLMNSRLEDTIKSLTIFTLLSTMKFYLFLFNIRYRLKVGSGINMLEEIISHLKKDPYESVPIINVYFNVLMIAVEPDQIEYYYKAKENFFKHGEAFHILDSINIYINLENYLWKQYRKGHYGLTVELMTLYKRRLETKVYKLGGYMPGQIYKRVVRTALLTEDPGFAESFMQKYKNELKPDFKKSIYSYCCALCCFYNKDFGKALEHLSVAENEDTSHKLDVKNLVLFINFASGDLKSLKLALDSYRHFLANNRSVSEYVKERAAITYKYMSKLARSAAEGNKEKLKVFKEELKKLEELESRQWYEQQVDRLLME